ncbi:MAG: hypothetical protein FJ207_12920 [Gemmatimonadetes bacterium]|nr:hypothetical protein [Gemmatimonadota bacterium]
MRSLLTRVLPLLVISAAACGPAEVVVTMEIEVDDPAGGGRIPRALSQVEVRLLPYDRDAVFDSIAAAYSTPEPVVPPDLLAAREQVRAAQAELEQTQQRWNALRDTLQKLGASMERLDRSSAEYTLLFRDFTNLEDQLPAVERQSDRAFALFDSLQRGTIRASDSVRILQENWSDAAFAGVADIFAAKVQASGLDLVVDTTDASGVARQHLLVRPGQYWVHARYELPYVELYWNMPVTVERGEPVQVRLTRGNAEERTRL